MDEDAEDVQLWGDNWDDDDAHYDDFANQLREEIANTQKAGGAHTRDNQQTAGTEQQHSGRGGNTMQAAHCGALHGGHVCCLRRQVSRVSRWRPAPFVPSCCLFVSMNVPTVSCIHAAHCS